MSLGAAGLGAAAFRGGITPLLSARSCLCSFLAQGTNPTASSSSGNIASCRQQHSLLKRTVQAVVPEHILSELRELGKPTEHPTPDPNPHRLQSSLLPSYQPVILTSIAIVPPPSSTFSTNPASPPSYTPHPADHPCAQMTSSIAILVWTAATAAP